MENNFIAFKRKNLVKLYKDSQLVQEYDINSGVLYDYATLSTPTHLTSFMSSQWSASTTTDPVSAFVALCFSDMFCYIDEVTQLIIKHYDLLYSVLINHTTKRKADEITRTADLNMDDATFSAMIKDQRFILELIDNDLRFSVQEYAKYKVYYTINNWCTKNGIILTNKTLDILTSTVTRINDKIEDIDQHTDTYKYIYNLIQYFIKGQEKILLYSCPIHVSWAGLFSNVYILLQQFGMPFPKTNFFQCYAELKLLKEIKQDEETQSKLASYAESNEYLHFENGDFAIVIPTCTNDFIDESKQQSNCVKTYINQVADNRTKIVFIRKKTDITASYATCELNNHNHIEQCLKRFNEPIDDDTPLKNFCNAYEHYLAQFNKGIE